MEHGLFGDFEAILLYTGEQVAEIQKKKSPRWLACKWSMEHGPLHSLLHAFAERRGRPKADWAGLDAIFTAFCSILEAIGAANQSWHICPAICAILCIGRGDFGATLRKLM